MKCSKCRLYSYAVRRCSLGKINPPTIKRGVEAASVMGISYICGLDSENQAKKEKVRTKLLEVLGGK